MWILFTQRWILNTCSNRACSVNWIDSPPLPILFSIQSRLKSQKVELNTSLQKLEFEPVLLTFQRFYLAFFFFFFNEQGLNTKTSGFCKRRWVSYGCLHDWLERLTVSGFGGILVLYFLFLFGLLLVFCFEFCLSSTPDVTCYTQTFALFLGSCAKAVGGAQGLHKMEMLGSRSAEFCNIIPCS
jgi:hypothetical protein